MECPDANLLLDLAAGELGDDEREELFAHADECADCRQLLAAVARQAAPPGDGEAERPPPILPRGTRVGRYQIESVVGSGGLGVVYAAHDPELGRRVALKLLRAGPGGGQERLVREARALARVSHPNVVVVHDAGTWEDRVFIAMELVAGTDLRDWLAQKPRRWREVVDVFLAAGRGLAAAHTAGVVHRDVKPENVLIGEDGRVCVSDFGLARASGEAVESATATVGGGDALQAPLTQDGAIVGTPAYMAPEQHQGDDADARSDQFSFCASLYEALFGVRPFAGATYGELRAAVLAGRVRPAPRARVSRRQGSASLRRPLGRAQGVPRTLERIVLRGLRRAPGERWPSMAELLAALGRDRSKWPRRAAGLAAALLAVLATALTADWILRERDAAVARVAFAGSRREVERAVARSYAAFASLAEMSTMLPVLREVAAARDQAGYGLGSPDADARALEVLHASLRDADWDAWSATTRLGAVAVADAKGRLLYTTIDRDRFGQDVRRVRAVADAYRPGGPGGGTQVLRAQDPALLASGLAAERPDAGLVVVFAHASVLGGAPQAALIQTLSGRRLLEDLASDGDVRLGLVAPDGAADGDVASDLLAAAIRARGGVVEAGLHGRRWLVQGHPLPGLLPGAPVATLVLARPADVGLAGLFPHARLVLLVAAALALVVLLASLVALSR